MDQIIKELEYLLENDAERIKKYLTSDDIVEIIKRITTRIKAEYILSYEEGK